METEDYESQNFRTYKGGDMSNLRLGFVKKVYSIISVQLLLTSILVYAAQNSLKTWFQDPTNTTAQALLYLAMAVSFITMIAIACYTENARTVPTNYILLGIFTVSEAYMVAFFTTFFNGYDVVMAAFLTFSLTVALTVYAYTTKSDFTMLGGTLWILGWGLVAITLLLSLMTFGNYKAWRTLDIIISVLAICLYGVYLIYDTQMIMGGKRFSLSLDDYILAAMAIYLDIIILFMRILRILGALRGRN